MGSKTRLQCPAPSGTSSPTEGCAIATPAVEAWVLLRAHHPQRRLHYGRPTAAADSALRGQRTVAQAPLPRSPRRAEGLPERGRVSGVIGLGRGWRIGLVGLQKRVLGPAPLRCAPLSSSSVSVGLGVHCRRSGLWILGSVRLRAGALNYAVSRYSVLCSLALLPWLFPMPAPVSLLLGPVLPLLLLCALGPIWLPWLHLHSGSWTLPSSKLAALPLYDRSSH